MFPFSGTNHLLFPVELSAFVFFEGALQISDPGFGVYCVKQGIYLFTYRLIDYFLFYPFLLSTPPQLCSQACTPLALFASGPWE